MGKNKNPEPQPCDLCTRTATTKYDGSWMCDSHAAAARALDDGPRRG